MAEQASTQPFELISEVRELVADFENGTLPRADWNHRAHLTVALWFLMHLEEHQACDRVITGIRRYNRVHRIRQTATGGYHETLTLFWLAVARAFLAGAEGSVIEKVNAFLHVYGVRKDLVFDYYSRERIFSWRARHFWVAPDRKSLNLDSRAQPRRLMPL